MPALAFIRLRTPYCRFPNIPFMVWRGFVYGVIVSFLLLVPASGAGPPITIHADVATAREGGQVLEAQGHVVLTDGRTTLRADHVLYLRKDGRIKLTGHVHIATVQGELLAERATSRLGARGRLEMIDAAGAVTVRSVDRTMRADQVRYETRDQTLTAVGHVEVTFPPDLRITGWVLVASGAEVAVLTGRPRIQHSAGSLEGDRVDVAVQSQIAFVRGNVRSEFGETHITSGLATLLVREKRAIFRDHVTVDRPGRTMTADVVTYYYAEQRLVAEGPTTIKIRQAPP